MHPKLQKAINAAETLMKDLVSGETSPVAELERLKKLTKPQLIAELMELKLKKLKTASVEDLVYAIMESTDCAELSYGMIAAIVVKYKPGKTKATNISWYASKAIEKERSIVPRICQQEFNKMMLESVI
jgi:hypothetical protein